MQNFMQIPPRGASRQMGEIYAKIFVAVHIPFFQKLTYRSDSAAVSRKDVPFWGDKIKNLYLTYLFKKFQKITIKPMGKIKQFLNGHNFGCV